MTMSDVWGRVGAEFEKFIEWARKQYPREAGRFTVNNFKDSDAYRFWMQQGRPTARFATPEEKYLEKFRPREPEYVGEPRATREQMAYAEQEAPWMATGQTQEMYEAERPWLKLDMPEEEWLKRSMGMWEDPQDLRTDVAEWQEMNRQLGFERQGRLGAEAMSRLWSRQLTEARGGELSMQQKADVAESVRGQLLSGLDPFIDAFQYWTIANAPNKWARKIQEGRDEMSPSERSEKWELEVEKARTRFKKVNEIHKAASSDPGRKLSFGEQQEFEQASLHLTNALQESVQADKVLAGEANYYDRNFASDAPTWERDPRTGEKIGDPHYGGIVGAGTSQSAKRRPWRTPETPPAPEWLAKYWPEATQTLDPSKYDLRGTTGLRAQRMTGLTPSAQGWARMLPSEQAGFMSHTRWSGGVPMDTLGRMEAMLPGTRTGSQWQPYRR